VWYIVYKLLRPGLPLSAALSAWIASQVCGANTSTSLAASATIALSTIGASLYHYGCADKMYVRKSDWYNFQDPKLLMILGLSLFCASVVVAVEFLPKTCVYVALLDTLAVAAYSAKLSAHWTTKNLTMSAVCTTPVILGWQAGNSTHPMIPLAILVAALAHLAREMVKDTKDIRANHGLRVTLPMLIGIPKVLQIAGILLVVAAGIVISLFRYTQEPIAQAMFACSIAILLLTAYYLLKKKEPGQGETAVTASLFCLMLALV
jgi:4-hydroxybenzoate polyprenyltransferase